VTVTTILEETGCGALEGDDVGKNEGLEEVGGIVGADVVGD